MQKDSWREVELFSGMSDEDLQVLEDVFTRKEYPAHHTIFWMGDRGTDFYIISDGSVEFTVQDSSGAELSVATLGRGDYFGELSLMDGGPRVATARSKESTTCLVLPRDKFLGFLKRHPTAALHVLETLGRRQRKAIEQIRSVRNANDAIQVTVEKGPLWPRIADKIAAVSASKFFLIFHLFWFTGWIGGNLYLGDRAFDPFPFGLLTMTVSLEAIFLSIFVLVSANRQSERDRIRADVDHHVNIKAHYEVLHLQRQIENVLERLKERDNTSRDN